MNNIETNFMNFEDLTKLIEEHKKETYPYKTYKFDSTSYTLLLIDINKLLKENKKLKDNWNKLKMWLNNFHRLSTFEQWEIVNKIQELEQGGNVDE